MLRKTKESELLGFSSAKISEQYNEIVNLRQLNQKYEKELNQLRKELSSLRKSINSFILLKGLSQVIGTLLDSRNSLHEEVKNDLEDLVVQCIENLKLSL